MTNAKFTWTLTAYHAAENETRTVGGTSRTYENAAKARASWIARWTKSGHSNFSGGVKAVSP